MPNESAPAASAAAELGRAEGWLREVADQAHDTWLPEPDGSRLTNGEFELVSDRSVSSDGMTDDELPASEAARARRRDRDMEAERRALMRPGMAKVFRQVTEASAKPCKPQRQKAKRAKQK